MILLLAGACCWAGFLKSRALTGRRQELTEWMVLLERWKGELCWKHLPTRELIEQSASWQEVGHLVFLPLCLQKLRQGQSLGQAWESALQEASNRMDWNQEDIRMAGLVGSFLGASDAQTQSQELQMVLELAEGRLSQAREDELRLGKLYRSLGLLSGAGIAVFLL